MNDDYENVSELRQKLSSIIKDNFDCKFV